MVEIISFLITILCFITSELSENSFLFQSTIVEIGFDEIRFMMFFLKKEAMILGNRYRWQ